MTVNPGRYRRNGVEADPADFVLLGTIEGSVALVHEVKEKTWGRQVQFDLLPDAIVMAGSRLVYMPELKDQAMPELYFEEHFSPAGDPSRK